ncbi:type II secretion system F family protein [Candidatus Symbiopectobacterium sp. NZEC135]|uniref:type II secretion system F family protein n=1 Tax=Candidatus Symbiopectobacterium sp. NZEC135 TaxID=2820471 RepID=UPI002227F48C|nr:type II secretion system F family protein [Candidatus Symbiopectobacterium sp. NZEC135]MCW2480009.1 type II secretion system F family protein [Candidatus Symbiopectobacterium sp. NZEC135]
MFYLFSLLMIALGLGGFSIHYLKDRNKNKSLALLNVHKHLLTEKVNQDDISHIETILIKSSRLILITALLDKNVILKMLTAVTLGGMLFLLNVSGILQVSVNVLLICFLILSVSVIILPDVIKKRIIVKRLKNISNDLPFIIDMMAVCIQSGMTVEKSMRYISENTKHVNRDIARILERVMLKTEVSGINAALEQLYQEIASNEVRMLCTTLQQSINFGSSIYKMLIALGKEMRDIQLLDMEEKVASLSAKMTMPMIGFIMFPLLAIIVGPGLIGMMALWGS